MLKSIIIVLVLFVFLHGDEDFSDKDMANNVNLILQNKQKVYTVSSLVKNLFKIKARGEFETKKLYEARINKIIGSGVFYIYKKIDTVKYNIDKKLMIFNFPLQGDIITNYEKANNELRKKGYDGVRTILHFNDQYFPIIKKMKLIKNKYSHPYAYINMDVKEAKILKTKNNTFFQIVAVKVTSENILKRIIEDSYGTVNNKAYKNLHLIIPMASIGTAIVSTNPKKIIIALGKN